MVRLQKLIVAFGFFSLGFMVAGNLYYKPPDRIGRFNIQFNHKVNGRVETVWTDQLCLDSAMTIHKNDLGNTEVSFINYEGNSRHEVCQNSDSYFSIWLPKMKDKK